MKVRDIMTARVVSVSREATVTDAARTMRDEQVGCVLVVEEAFNILNVEHFCGAMSSCILF